MPKEETKLDDHHCAVIERDRIKTELADCDSVSASETDKEDCRNQVKETSKRREQQCKYS